MADLLSMEEVFGSPATQPDEELLSMDEVFEGEATMSPAPVAAPEAAPIPTEDVFTPKTELKPLEWHRPGAEFQSYVEGENAFSGVVHDEDGAAERQWKARYIALTGKNPDYEGVTKEQAELEINQVRPNIPSALAAAAQSAVDVVASVPKSIAIAIEAGDTRILGALDKIDAGEQVSPFGLPMVNSATVHRYQQATPEARVKIREGLGDPRRPEDNFLYQFGEQMQEATREAIPTDPEAEETISHKLMRGVGSTAGFAAAGIVGRILAGPGMMVAGASAATLGASAQATSQFEDAVHSGADLETAYEASKLGAVVGLSEGAPIARLLDRYDKATGGTLRKVIKEGLKGGAEEGAQELFQSVMDWAIAQKLYDPERELLKPAAESTGIGVTIGFMFSVFAAMLGFKVRGPVRTGHDEPGGETPADGGGPEPQEGETTQTTAQPEAAEGEFWRGGEAARLNRSGKVGNFSASDISVGDTFIAEDGSFTTVGKVDKAGNFTTTTGRDKNDPSHIVEPFAHAPVNAEEVVRRLNLENAQKLEPVAVPKETTEEEAGAEPKTPVIQEPAGNPHLEEALNLMRGKGAMPKQPQTLTRFLVKEGGIREESGELATMGVSSTTRPGLVSKKGRTFEEAAERAWEEGFFPMHQEGPPSAREFLEALRGDFTGQAQLTHPKDEMLVQRHAMMRDLDEALFRSGIDMETLTNREIEKIMNLEIDLGVSEGGDTLTDTAASRTGTSGMEAGTRYVGMVGDMPGEVIQSPAGDAALAGLAAKIREIANGPQKKEPLRREAILRKLTKALGVPLYQGRVKGGKRLGFFRHNVEEVRLKNMNDIEVAAHEFAHLLDSRIPEISQQWKGKSARAKLFRKELQSVSYDVKKTYEGFAEFVRLWSTQRDKARAAAPNFYAWFEDFIGKSEYGPALRESQADMHDWFAQDLATRGKSKIGDGGEMNAALDSIWERFRQGVTDDLDGWLKMETALTGSTSWDGMYKTARLTRGKHTVVEGAIKYGIPVTQEDGSIRFEGKGLMELLEPVGEQLDDYLAYAVAKRADYLRGQGRERLFTPGEIKAMQDVTREQRELFDGVLKDYQAFNKGILDFAQARGVINPAKRKEWETDVYIPFNRVSKTAPTGKAKGTPGDWTGIKMLTGGTGNLRDVLGNMVQNVSMLIDAALTNEARQKAAEVLQKKGGARFMARIPKDSRKLSVTTQSIEQTIMDTLGIPPTAARLMRAKGGVRLAGLPEGIEELLDALERQGPLVEFWAHNQKPSGENVVAVMFNGETTFFEVYDDLVLRSFHALNRPAKHWIVKWLAVPKRIGQATITLTIDFMAANIARDTLMGTIFSKFGFRFALDSWKGLKSRVLEDPLYKEAIANGVGFSSYLVDEDSARRELNRMTREFYGKKGIDWKMVLDTPDRLFLALERFANAFEMATRLGEYGRARAAGAHPKEAAYAAREVSTDFGMRGDSLAIGFFYDTIIFLKAAVNGIDRGYRGLFKDPNRRQIAFRTGMLALLSMGLYAINRGNPLYDDLEDWRKDLYWHFFIPTEEAITAWATGQDLPPLDERYEHFQYPKIWEIGAVASAAERALEGILDAEPVEAAKHMARVIAEVFRMEYIPAAFAPLYELAINENRFSDRPIESEAMKDLEPWARSGPYGSEMLRRLGETMRDWPGAAQLSPAQFESLIRGYFHTWGMYGLTLLDVALFDDMPEMRLDQYPLIRRFYRQHPGGHSKYVTKVYELIGEATKARRTLRHMDKTYRPDIADDIENKRENLLYGQLSRAEKQLRAINQDMARVLYARDIEPLQELARERAKISTKRGYEDRLRRSGAWYDMSKLKRALRDDLIVEQHRYAKDVIEDIEKQKEPAK